MPNEFKTENTDEAVCPHCGYQQSDTWEYFLGVDEPQVKIHCQDCEEMMMLSRELRVSYSTYKPVARS